MKILKISALLFISFLFIQATSVNENTLVLNGSISEEIVTFTIENTSPVDIGVNHIIIQDNVLLLDGNTTIGSGVTEILQVQKNGMDNQVYNLTITTTTGTPFTKSFIVSE